MGEGELETAGHVLGTGLGVFRGLREGAGGERAERRGALRGRSG